ncbi:hypothetical protein CYLTODRAFT_445003 [Cylindrobasidium torrendii FP15055 ss-10]|uniref:F-box domain-containing protein n=1 Tax=Cylindrobasidium torrendii FP15055 ss-10 TaxID=1314674 RepID=A0A0D7B6Y7_9AGAR|nr:hypothetical protein CYLTODRAFT_445003 [Cylindrobasidium torrendii FP15055 ss-10]
MVTLRPGSPPCMHLPSELYALIVAACAHIDISTLPPLALTCREFYTMSRRHPWRDLAARYCNHEFQREIAALREPLLSLPGLGKTIRSLTIVGRGAAVAHADPEVFDVLRALENLQEFSLRWATLVLIGGDVGKTGLHVRTLRLHKVRCDNCEGLLFPWWRTFKALSLLELVDLELPSLVDELAQSGREGTEVGSPTSPAAKSIRLSSLILASGDEGHRIFQIWPSCKFKGWRMVWVLIEY